MWPPLRQGAWVASTPHARSRFSPQRPSTGRTVGGPPPAGPPTPARGGAGHRCPGGSGRSVDRQLRRGRQGEVAKPRHRRTSERGLDSRAGAAGAGTSFRPTGGDVGPRIRTRDPQGRQPRQGHRPDIRRRAGPGYAQDRGGTAAPPCVGDVLRARPVGDGRSGRARPAGAGCGGLSDRRSHHDPSDACESRCGGQRREISGLAHLLTSMGAPPPILFRPPFGSFNATTLGILQRERMLGVLWTADTKDYERPGKKQIIYTAVSAAQPGAIVLMHDGPSGRSQTAAALPRIIVRLRQRGYRLVTVPQMMRENPPPRGTPAPASLAGN